MSENAPGKKAEPERDGLFFPQGLCGAFDFALWRFDDEQQAHHAKWIAQHSDEYQERLKQATTIAAVIFGDIEKLGDLTITPFIEHMTKLREHAGEGDDIAVTSAVFGALQTQIGIKIVEAGCNADGERLFHLLLLMRQCGTSKKARQFLKFVSRCYLFGFDVECIAMCRAALEAKLRAEIGDDDCITALGHRDQFTANQRIEAASKLGRISTEIMHKANLVRENGNDVLHKSPVLPRPAIDVINDTLSVFEALG